VRRGSFLSTTSAEKRRGRGGRIFLKAVGYDDLEGGRENEALVHNDSEVSASKRVTSVIEGGKEGESWGGGGGGGGVFLKKKLKTKKKKKQTWVFGGGFCLCCQNKKNTKKKQTTPPPFFLVWGVFLFFFGCFFFFDFVK